MGIDQKIIGLCEPYVSIRVLEVNLYTMTVSVILPYESNAVSIDISGETELEIIESFKVGVNDHLEEMRDHLEACKFD